MTTDKRTEARAWAEAWPVGTQGEYYLGHRFGWRPVTVVGIEWTRGWPSLELSWEKGTVYCKFGRRRDLAKIIEG